jgi:uncharacterized protein
MTLDRRRFLQATSTAFTAFLASGCAASAGARGLTDHGGSLAPYGPLLSDPAGLLDLPAGFSYRVLSSLGDPMDDGGTVPNHADGMGCFDLGGGRLALVRNHELNPGQSAGAELDSGYGRDADGTFLPGGTTTIVLNAGTLAVERQFRSLAGTLRNCAGGTTPWGTWLSCEEPNIFQRRLPNHGYVFEVPAAATGLVDPVPLRAMGRFDHEAAAVDPATGIVYMTEDKTDGLFYRFIPNRPGVLLEGGKLQALAVSAIPDARNHSSVDVPVGSWHEARWLDLEDVEARELELRERGAAQGCTLFSRGEGLWMGDGEMYFCCTSGGAAKLGQIYRLRPQADGPDRLQLFFESRSTEQFNFGDNLTVAPNGHLIVCEDQYSENKANHLRGITPAGEAYPLGLCRLDSEIAGACFSPDGRTLFANIFGPTKTLAITGPWIAALGG